MEPAVELRFIVPVPALTFNPPEKLAALLMLPDELRLMMSVPAAVPTEPAKPSDPPLAVRLMVAPVIDAAADELRLFAAVKLNTPAAPELLLTLLVPAFESVMNTFCPAPSALAERFGADSVTGVANAPTEPAVDVRLIVPVAPLTLNPPEKLPALLKLPAEVSEIEFVVAVPTAPARVKEPALAVRLISVPVIETPAPVLRLPAALTLNVAPAPELLLMLVLPALLSVTNTFCPALFALAEKFGELNRIGVPSVPTEPEVDVRLTVPVAAFVVTLADVIDAFEVNETVSVVAVPTAPDRPRAPPVAVNIIVLPVIAAAAEVFKLFAAIRLNVLPAPELDVTVVVAALLSLMYTSCAAVLAFAEMFGAASVTAVAEVPIEPALDVRLIVPVAALTLSPPEKLDALLMLPAELSVIELLLAVPTAPASPSEPPVALRLMSVPVITAAADEFKFVPAVTLNVAPAPELLLALSEPAELMYTF